MKTIILTTHNMDEADRLADRVAIIDQGNLLILDTPQALKQRVGNGDVLEIYLANGDTPRKFENIKECLFKINKKMQISIAGSMLTVRVLDAVNLLPHILDALKTMGINVGEVRLRQNTLEDVFIQLTGRRLRE